MRRLLPTYDEHVDLVAAYAYPEGAWVRANMVCSADGSAVVDGRSGGLSGPADKQVFGTLRGLCDVVLVGGGTARAEGYRAPRPREEYAGLRERQGQPPAPVLAVVSRRLALEPTSPLFAAEVGRTIVVTPGSSDPEARARLAEVADVVVAGKDTVDLAGALAQLAESGLRRVLCEGGPSLLGDLARAGRLDELCVTVSPRLVGGPGPRILGGPALHPLLDLTVGHLLEQDDNLFARYVRR